MRDAIYGTVLAIVCTGLVFAADQRIDKRVQMAIDASNEQRLEQEIQFYIMKDEMVGLTGEDRINKTLKERQLEKLRGQ